MGEDVNVHHAEPITYYVSLASFSMQLPTIMTIEPKIPHVVQATIWNKDSYLFPDLLFSYNDSLMALLKMYSIKRHHNYKVKKTMLQSSWK